MGDLEEFLRSLGKALVSGEASTALAASCIQVEQQKMHDVHKLLASLPGCSPATLNLFSRLRPVYTAFGGSDPGLSGCFIHPATATRWVAHADKTEEERLSAFYCFDSSDVGLEGSITVG